MKNSPYNSVTYGLPSGDADTGFNAQTFWQNYGAQQRQLQMFKLNKEAQNRKAWESAYDPSKLVPAKIYAEGADEINSEIDKFSEYQAQNAINGKTPNLDKEYAASKARINNLATMQADNQAKIEETAQAYTKDLGKYHPSTYETWLKDMPTGIEERNKYLNTTSPLQEDVHWQDVLLKWTGEADKTESAGGVTTTALNRDKVRQRIIDNYSMLPKPEQALMLDEAMAIEDPVTGKPIATDLTTAIEWATDKAMNMGAVSVERVGNTGKGGGNDNEGPTNEDAVNYTIGRDNQNDGVPVRVSFGHTRENPVTMELVTNDNQKRNVNVIGLHQEGGKWVIDITYEGKNGKEEMDIIAAEKFDGSPQSKDTHNYQRISDYMGGDFVEKVYGAKTDEKEAKSAKKTNFVGVPENGF